MSITGPMVLPPALLIIPASELSEETRIQCACAPEDFIVTRPRSRKQSSVVSPRMATLLASFREPTTIVDAVLRLCAADGTDPESTLDEAFAALQPFLQARWLVREGSPEAESIEWSLQPGERVDGYEVVECVNLLEDTEVYQVRATNDTFAALKLVRPGGALLNREATILRRIDLPTVPRLLGTGTLRGEDYLLMQWRAGVPVAHAAAELRHLGRTEWRRDMLKLCCDVLRAYGALHDRGVVHGDVYGKNILVDSAGQISVIDFGCSRFVTENEDTPIQRRGVPEFYEPEFAMAARRGQPHPPASLAGEQYALAVLVDWLVTGTPYLRFSAERDEMLHEIVECRPLTFAERGVPAWPAVELVLRRALEKEPEQRFKSVRDLLLALESCDWPVANAGTAVEAQRSMRQASELFSRLDADDIDGFTLGSDVPTASITYGAAGVAYAMYRASCLDADPSKLAAADGWIQRALRSVECHDAFASEALSLDGDQVRPSSIYFGVAGVHLVHALVSHALGDDASLRSAIDKYVTACGSPNACIDLTLGRAGVLIGCTFLLDAISPKSDDLAYFVSQLADLARTEVRGIADRYEVHREQTTDFLGIAHGWAGACYAVLSWSELSGDVIPDTVVHCLNFLEAQAQERERGVRWPMKRHGAGAETRWFESWCHGAAGYVPLWTTASRVLRAPRYLELAEKAAWTVWDAGECDGSLCCGYSGRAYALLNMFRHTGDDRWLSRAFELSRRALRASPLDKRLEYSLFKGSLGAAVLAADLVEPQSASYPLFEPNMRGAVAR